MGGSEEARERIARCVNDAARGKARGRRGLRIGTVQRAAARIGLAPMSVMNRFWFRIGTLVDWADL